jgi:hypothetical protein
MVVLQARGSPQPAKPSRTVAVYSYDVPTARSFGSNIVTALVI